MKVIHIKELTMHTYTQKYKVHVPYEKRQYIKQRKENTHTAATVNAELTALLYEFSVSVPVHGVNNRGRGGEPVVAA